MSRVSRSFALVVPWLEEPLQQQMATAYLICRTLDNIEDCAQSRAWQKARFAEFTGLLAEPAHAPLILSQWETYTWPGLSPDEAALMTLEDGLPLWLIYATFPDPVRAIFQHWISLMAVGMESVLDPQQTTSLTMYGDVRLLSTVRAYDEYCYYVAGTIGGLATELVSDHYQLTAHERAQLLEGSKACGRALQKTNIIKDFVEDLKRQVCFLPDEWLREIDYMPLRLAGAPAEWTYVVLKNVLDELRAATAYVCAIPATAAGYRISSLVCLLPAYQTLLSTAQQQPCLFTQGHQVKIARETMARCLHDAVSMAPDNDAISAYCHQLEQAISTAFWAQPDGS